MSASESAEIQTTVSDALAPEPRAGGRCYVTIVNDTLTTWFDFNSVSNQVGEFEERGSELGPLGAKITIRMRPGESVSNLSDAASLISYSHPLADAGTNGGSGATVSYKSKPSSVRANFNAIFRSPASGDNYAIGSSSGCRISVVGDYNRQGDLVGTLRHVMTLVHKSEADHAITTSHVQDCVLKRCLKQSTDVVKKFRLLLVEENKMAHKTLRL